MAVVAPGLLMAITALTSWVTRRSWFIGGQRRLWLNAGYALLGQGLAKLRLSAVIWPVLFVLSAGFISLRPRLVGVGGGLRGPALRV